MCVTREDNILHKKLTRLIIVQPKVCMNQPFTISAKEGETQMFLPSLLSYRRGVSPIS